MSSPGRNTSNSDTSAALAKLPQLELIAYHILGLGTLVRIGNGRGRDRDQIALPTDQRMQALWRIITDRGLST